MQKFSTLNFASRFAPFQSTHNSPGATPEQKMLANLFICFESQDGAHLVEKQQEFSHKDTGEEFLWQQMKAKSSQHMVKGTFLYEVLLQCLPQGSARVLITDSKIEFLPHLAHIKS